jgi:hypothetical protein
VYDRNFGGHPVLMGAANSSGGVMGKMIDAQSIVVAATAQPQKTVAIGCSPALVSYRLPITRDIIIGKLRRAGQTKPRAVMICHSTIVGLKARLWTP